MTKKPESVNGDIFVSPEAVATIASQSLLTCYGVVGMASKNAFGDLAASLVRDPNHGITVNYIDEGIVIDTYVIIQHGTRITSVANSVINAVRFNVEKNVGLPVVQINVYVQGLRLSE